jgi:hypothetical protein
MKNGINVNGCCETVQVSGETSVCLQQSYLNNRGRSAHATYSSDTPRFSLIGIEVPERMQDLSLPSRN